MSKTLHNEKNITQAGKDKDKHTFGPFREEGFLSAGV